MGYLPIVIVTLVLGAACGYFQYWMAVRLDRKRWLLLLQPGLLAVVTAFLAAWIAGWEQLEGTAARWMWTPFALLLLCCGGGWIAAAVERGRRKRDD